MAELHNDEDRERHSSWLENFYDLIVAIVVAQLAVGLKNDISILNYAGFVFLFIPVWWSWLGVTFYNTRFETDDVQHRLLTLLQMAAAAFMAVNVVNGLSTDSIGFALSYSAIRTILVVEYLLTGRRIKSARPLTGLFSKGFMSTTVLWIVSVFVPPPIRFYLWFAGLAIDIAIPLFLTRRVSNRFAPHIYHLPDRFGSFTIIVLGITILAFFNKIVTHNWTFTSVLSAMLSLSVAFCIWWIYFDSIDGSAVKAFRKEKRLAPYFGWLYIHFPLLIGIVGFGVSIEHIVLSNDSPLPTSDKWLMCGSIILCLVSLGVIRITSFKARSKKTKTRSPSTEEDDGGITDRNQAFCAFVAAGLILLFAVTTPDLLPLYLISVIAITLGALVVLDIKHHPFHLGLKQSQIHE